RTGPPAMEVLRAFVAGHSKPRAIEMLHELEPRLGQAEAIDELCAELEDQIRMSCPRCQVELRRLDMIGHLWDQHRLILDGRRVREPEGMLRDWVEESRLEKDPALLERCHTLAARLDPAGGKDTLRRLLLQRGVDDPEARRALRARAHEK